MTTYNRKFIEARFQALLELTGNTLPAYVKGDKGGQKARVGAWYLDYAACYGGYSVNEIVNDMGGVRQVTGWCNRMKAGELVAWMDGYSQAYGKRV